uniref:MABP domain-containing protein n=1 Tax=Plectus sambesii TaxID=2011161 RepID=A0A914W046_9BILA
MGDATASNPLTAICIVADKNRCPTGFLPIAKSFDDQTEADVWKDGFFTLSRVYRYIAFSKVIQPNAFVVNVVADVCVVADREVVPSGFVPIELTDDTREKALRKKQLCVRYVPRDTAVDAVCDLIILTRQKKPPNGYSMAGDIDGLTICYKFGVIPPMG